MEVGRYLVHFVRRGLATCFSTFESIAKTFGSVGKRTPNIIQTLKMQNCFRPNFIFMNENAFAKRNLKIK
jgi:hypothetical protein